MATQYLTLNCKIRYPQNIDTLDEFRGTKFWKISCYDLDEKSMADYKASGCQVNAKADKKDGELLYTFRRPYQKLIKNELVEFEPPKLEYAKGQELGEGQLIGNGSDAQVTIAVYDTGTMGKGHRLQSVKITKLEPYEAEAISSDEVVDKSAFE